MSDLTQKQVHHLRHVIYLVSFLFTLHIAIPIYINSTFLSNVFGEQWVSLLYITGALVTFFVMWLTGLGLKRFGNVAMTLMLVILEISVLVLMAVSGQLLLILPAFVLHFTLTTVIGFETDIFLEAYTGDNEVGSVRGVHLTINNIGLAISPILAGFLIARFGFQGVYISSAILLLPILLIVVTELQVFKDPSYHVLESPTSVLSLLKDPLMRRVSLINLTLRFFFAVMVVYVPLYLIQVVGFSIKEMGGLLSIMLLAFVFFETPFGKLSDKPGNERRILLGGIVTMACMTILVGTISTDSFLIWATVLFMSRVGAAMLDVGSESIFFRHTDSSDAGAIELFRLLRPFAYILATLVGAVVIYFSNFQTLFIVLSAIVLLGLTPVEQLTATRYSK